MTSVEYFDLHFLFGDVCAVAPIFLAAIIVVSASLAGNVTRFKRILGTISLRFTCNLSSTNSFGFIFQKFIREFGTLASFVHDHFESMIKTMMKLNVMALL